MANFSRISCNLLFKGYISKHLVGGGNTSVRTIISRATIPEHLKPSKPKPWPYKNKGYNWFTHLYDKTSSRFDENSVVNIIVF